MTDFWSLSRFRRRVATELRPLSWIRYLRRRGLAKRNRARGAPSRAVDFAPPPQKPRLREGLSTRGLLPRPASARPSPSSRPPPRSPPGACSLAPEGQRAQAEKNQSRMRRVSLFIRNQAVNRELCCSWRAGHQRAPRSSSGASPHPRAPCRPAPGSEPLCRHRPEIELLERPVQPPGLEVRGPRSRGRRRFVSLRRGGSGRAAPCSSARPPSTLWTRPRPARDRSRRRSPSSGSCSVDSPARPA